MIEMAEKKNKGRFTLQFNPADPQQLKVAELLEQQGRHKAQFLTSVVLHYIHCPETPDIAQSTQISGEELEKRVLEILRRLPAGRLSEAAEEIDLSVEADVTTPDEIEGFGGLFGPEASSAIANTLSAFCRE